MVNKQHCTDCKYHSIDLRRKAEGVGDGDLELVSFADKPAKVVMCRVQPGRPAEMGFAEDDVGAKCPLFERPKRSLDPELVKLLARRGL